MVEDVEITKKCVQLSPTLLQVQVTTQLAGTKTYILRLDWTWAILKLSWPPWHSSTLLLWHGNTHCRYTECGGIILQLLSSPGCLCAGCLSIPVQATLPIHLCTSQKRSPSEVQKSSCQATQKSPTGEAKT